MSLDFDVGSLIWVKAEIDSAIGHARGNVQQLLAQPEDETQLKFAQTHLHQVTGALEMVGLGGLTLFAQSIESLIAAMLRGESQRSTENLQILDQSMAQVTDFIATLIDGGTNSTLRLGALYRALNEARNNTQFTESDLFFPDLTANLPKHITALSLPADQVQAKIKQLRTRYQTGLLRWLRTPSREPLQLLASALSELASTQSAAQQRGFWWSAATFAHALADDPSLDAQGKVLLSKLDQQIRRLADSGAKIPEPFHRQMLYLIGTTHSTHPDVIAVRAAYGLPAHFAVSLEDHKNLAPQFLRQLKEGLEQVKDLWMRVAGGQTDRFSQFKQQLDKWLALIGGQQLATLEQLGNGLAQWLSTADQPNEQQAMDVATALLLAENILAQYPQESADLSDQIGFVLRRLADGATDEDVDMPALDEISRQAQEKLLLAQVVHEILANLQQIEQQLDEFFRDHTKRGNLASLPPLLRQVDGALLMLGADLGGKLLKQCQQRIHDLAVPDSAIVQSELEWLAESLSALGFYVEGLRTQQDDVDRLLLPMLQTTVPAPTQAEAPAKPEPVALDAAPEFEWDVATLSNEIETLPATPISAAPLISTEILAAELTPDVELAPVAEPVVTEAPPAEVATVIWDEAADEELLEIYLDEAQEILAQIDEQLEISRENPHSSESLTVLRRSFHTLKGSGRMVGLNQLGEVAWSVEQILNKWLQEERPAAPELLALVVHTQQAFGNWVTELQQNGRAAVNAAPIQALAEQFKNYQSGDLPTVPDWRTDGSAPVASTENDEAASSTDKLDDLEIPLLEMEEADTVTVEDDVDHSEEMQPTEFQVGGISISASLFYIFTVEAQKLLQTLDEVIEGLAESHGEISQQFTHAAHTLRGIANTCGFNLIGDLAEALEHFLLAKVQSQRPLDENEQTLVGETVFALRSMVEQVIEHQAPTGGETWIQALLTQLEALNVTSLEEALDRADVSDQPAPTETNTLITLDDTLDVDSLDDEGFDPLLLEIDVLEEMDAPVSDAPTDALNPPLEDAFILDLEQSLLDNQDTMSLTLEDASSPGLSATALSGDLDIPADGSLDAQMDAGIDGNIDEDIDLSFELDMDSAIPAAALERQPEAESTLDSTEDDLILEIETSTAPATLDLHEAPLGETVSDDALASPADPVLTFELDAPDLSDEELSESPVVAAETDDLSFEDELTIDLDLPAVELSHDELDVSLLIADEADSLMLEVESADNVAETTPPAEQEATEAEADEAALALLDGAAAADLADSLDLSDSLDLADAIESSTPPAPSFALPSESATPDADADAADDEEMVISSDETEEAAFDLDAATFEIDDSPMVPTLSAPSAVDLGVNTAIGHELIGIAAQSALSAAEDQNQDDDESSFAAQDDIDEQLLPIFAEEAEELFPAIAEALRDWRKDSTSQEPVQQLLRQLHTLKGSARMAGAMRMGHLAHELETRVQQSTRVGMFNDALFDTLDGELDAMIELLDRMVNGGTPEQIALDALAAADQPAVAEETRQEQDAKTLLRVRADLVDRLVNEAGEVSIARARIESEVRSLRASLFELTDNVSRLRNHLRELEIQAESQMSSRLSHMMVSDPTFDPLEFDRFTRLQELTRLLAESVNDVATVQHNLLKNVDDSELALGQQRRQTRELQQSLMRIRTMPFASLSDRLYRIVRQTAKDLGKKVNLEIKGGRLELDRSVLEKMTSALEHMLRNAIDHGLESKEGRLAAHKDEIGEILIEAQQEGNEMILTLKDDGAGIDPQRIRSKAISKGLIAADAVHTDQELLQIIFFAGFSTAEQVTQVSGRGIGMDVVKSEIENLGGRVEVSSVIGQGTSFILHLPLTLAVTQVVMVEVNGKPFAVPSGLVEQVMQVKIDVLNGMYAANAVEWQGATYPFWYLPRLLGDDTVMPEIQRYNTVVLVKSANRRVALHVDKLTRNQEVVVKNIGPQLARVIGVSGATVLGSGEIVLIINPVDLTAASERLTQAQRESVPEIVEVAAQPIVMVVDDSLTVRKITSRLLERQGYQVITAKDGVDALQQMVDFTPNVMLVDIEMPRMDGFELTRNVRGSKSSQHIPIIMISSRTADKHRKFAQELGVNMFLGKPYQEEELLEHIQKFLKEQQLAAM